MGKVAQDVSCLAFLFEIPGSKLFQVTACAHVFCKACLINFSASLGQVSCPSCSKLLTVDLTTNTDAGGQSSRTTMKGFKSSSILNRIQLNDFQTSTKIEALVCLIRILEFLKAVTRQFPRKSFYTL